jgi:hypothetical protein
MADTDLQGLLHDLYDELQRDHGVDIGPWDEFDGHVKPNVMALLFAPSDEHGVVPQAFFRPIDNTELAIAVANDAKRRLEAYRAGDDTVFQSYAPEVNRRLALIYHHGTAEW